MIAFIFADLIIIPILVIYRKYYGTKMMLFIVGIFYATMVFAAYIVEFLFGALGLIPTTRTAKVAETGITWNYTTILNIVFLALAAGLLVRFFRSGGATMLKMMAATPAGTNITPIPSPKLPADRRRDAGTPWERTRATWSPSAQPLPKRKMSRRWRCSSASISPRANRSATPC